ISSQKLPRPQSGLATTEEEINTKVLPILALALQHIFQVLPINFKKGALSRGQATVELFKYAKPITQVALAVILITSLHFFGKLYLHQSFHKKIDRNISSIITQYHPKAAEKYLNDPLKTKNFLKAEMKKAETLIGLAGGDPNSRIHPLHAIAKLTIVIRRHPQHDFIIDKIQFAQNQVKIEGSCKSEFAANALNSGLLEQPYVNMGSGYQDFPKFSQASSKPNVAPQTGAQGRVRFVFEYSLGVS
ncbi:MAG: hypothetical protein HYS98_08350, partial [Deltaproteobacteria bacterium]|nr:hypothetical protein [Deltaproteobacteria bacterium]